MKEKEPLADVDTKQSNAEKSRWRKKIPGAFILKEDPLFLFLSGILLITLLGLIGARTTLLIIKSGEEINPPRGVAEVPLSEWSERVHEEFLSVNERIEIERNGYE